MDPDPDAPWIARLSEVIRGREQIRVLLCGHVHRPFHGLLAGQVVTTADVIPSLRRWMGRDLVGTKLLAVLASLEPVDQTTFELKLRKPYPYLLFSLASGSGQLPVIMRAKDLEGDPAKPVTTAIGSGPGRGARTSQRRGSGARRRGPTRRRPTRR